MRQQPKTRIIYTGKLTQLIAIIIKIFDSSRFESHCVRIFIKISPRFNLIFIFFDNEGNPITLTLTILPVEISTTILEP